MVLDKWLSCVSIRDIAVLFVLFCFVLFFFSKFYAKILSMSSHTGYFKPFFSAILFFIFVFNLPLYTVINCTPLVPPFNGMISPSSCLSRSTYGQSCRFSCQRHGYSLEGTSVRVCGSEGEWTGNNDTICKGEDNCVQLSIVAC